MQKHSLIELLLSFIHVYISDGTMGLQQALWINFQAELIGQKVAGTFEAMGPYLPYKPFQLLNSLYGPHLICITDNTALLVPVV